jgi:hypothetical protein
MPRIDELYHIIREVDFDDKVKIITKNYKRMNDLDNAIDWALSRNPKALEVFNDEFYYWVTERWENKEIPQLRIFYHINEKKHIVTLIDITTIE